MATALSGGQEPKIKGASRVDQVLKVGGERSGTQGLLSEGGGTRTGWERRDQSEKKGNGKKRKIHNGRERGSTRNAKYCTKTRVMAILLTTLNHRSKIGHCDRRKLRNGEKEVA